MTNVTASAHAKRLLDPSARDARSELALTAMLDGVAHSLRIDRTFVDDAGTRWVIDWKTSTHEGGDREAFLDRELERYRGQLERYARVMAMREPGRPVRVGLYFPLLDAWRESPMYSPRERAALEWTEALTLVTEGHVPDEVYAAVREHFSEEELVNLSLAIVAINGWNRLCISFRVLPGTYKAKQAQAA